MIFNKQTYRLISMSKSRIMTRARSKSLVSMPNLRDIAMDSSLVMLAFLNSDNNTNRRVRFNEPLSVTFKEDQIPLPLLELLRHMNSEGVTVPDVFRRPGNTAEQKKLIKKLSEGKQIDFQDYNFYTLASVIKRFLLSIPGGILGKELEDKALTVIYLESKQQQLEIINTVIRCLNGSVQRFLTLLFGVWYRIADRHHLHKMTAEAMAKSVTGSIFLNATSDPFLVNSAAKVMQIMIENFPSPTLFGQDNLDFFHLVTEMEQYETNAEIIDQPDRNQEPAASSRLMPEPEDTRRFTIGEATQIKRPTAEDIKSQQLNRLKQRSDWFLNPNSAENSPKGTGRRKKFYGTRNTVAFMPVSSQDDEDSSSGDLEEITSKVYPTLQNKSCRTPTTKSAISAASTNTAYMYC